jgi:hypothetical protein
VGYHGQAVASLVRDGWIDASGTLKILVELCLRLVNPFGESVLLIFTLFKEHVISSDFRVFWSIDYSLPPWMSLDLIPVDPVHGVLLEHLLDQIVELL